MNMKTLFCLLLLAFPAAAAIQQAERPPLEVRRMAERHSVVVRTKDSLDQIQSYGMGLVVAEEGALGATEGRFIVATAKHVVRSDSGVTSIQVLPYEHIHWIDAEVLATGVPESTESAQDFAFLSIPRKRTELVHGALLTTFRRSPVHGMLVGEELWSLGYDQNHAETTWGTAQNEEATESLVTFSTSDVWRGFSGGVLMNRSGAVGLTVSVGSRGKGCKAIPFPHLARAADTAGVPFQLQEPVLAEAFRNCLQNGLLVSLCEAPRNRWLALSVDSEVALGFEGRWMTYGPDNNPGRSGTNGTWNAKLLGGALELDMSGKSELSGVEVRRAFAPSSDVDVRGHLLLASRGDAAVRYLAVPREICETLPARFLAAAAAGDMAGVTLSEPQPVQPEARVLGGQLAPLSFYLRTNRHFNNNRPSRVPFSLHEDWLGYPVTLAGRLLGPDSIDRQDEPLRTSWRQTPVKIFDETLGAVAVQFERDQDSPNDFYFQVEFEPQGRLCQVLVEEVDPRQSNEVEGLVLQAPVLIREAP